MTLHQGVGSVLLLLIAFADAGLECATATGPEKELSRFEGTWLVYKEISRGADFPVKKEGKVVIEGTKMKFYQEGKLVQTLGFSINPEKQPREIDLLYPGKGDAKGPVVPGIYRFDGDLLSIATGFGREERKTRPKSWADKSKLFILILKRSKAE